MYKVLIVDDEKLAREYIAELVFSYLPDSEIIKIDNPKTAIYRLLKEDFDILFLDVCMPGMTGLDLLEIVQSNGKHPNTVLVSAFREFDYAVKAIELGVVQYLTKPLCREKVYETLRIVLNNLNTKTLLFDTPKGLRRLIIEQILAIERLDRSRVKLYIKDAVIPYSTGTLGKLQPLLPAHFHYIRRNCILNYHAISEFNQKGHEVAIVCQNEKITFQASRENMKELASWIKGSGR